MEQPRRSLISHVTGAISFITNVRRGEWPLLILAFSFHFVLLAGYYMLRPIRDEIGAQQSDVLDLLWTYTFFALLVFVPLYTMIISRIPRYVFLPLVYMFLISNLVVFYLLFQSSNETVLRYSEQVFYVWLSSINLFAISVFWGFMADIFRSEQGKRLFGPIASGASLGGIAGPALVVWKVEEVGRPIFLLFAALGFFLAMLCVLGLHFASRRAPGATGIEEQRHESAEDDANANRSAKRRSPSILHALRGLRLVFSSPYLLAIAGFIFLLALGNSFLYFERSWLTREAIVDRAARTQFMGQIDLAVNLATILLQGLVVSRVIRLIGVGGTLAALPGINLLGFAVLGAALIVAGGIDAAREHATSFLAILVAFEVAQRACRYALARPAREVLFTVVGKHEKYESKAFIDTVVYRGGDVGSGIAFNWLFTVVGLSLGAIALVSIPAFVFGVGLSIMLGRMQANRANVKEGDEGADQSATSGVASSEAEASSPT